MTYEYCLPQQKDNPETNLRKVGFELEFSGIALKTVANIVAGVLGERPQVISEAECEVHNSQLGKFQIELDWQFAKDFAKERLEQRSAESEETSADDPLMEWVTKIAGQVVPIEVVCPPIPLDRLQCLDAMVEKLREGGAVGTEESLIYAFGVHINPELPALDAPTITHYLQSYILAEEWLVQKNNVDLMRRVTPYVDLFPKEYGILVAGYSDTLTQQQLIEEYLQYNPTRNRALDMLPLFKYLDEDRIIQALDDPRIKARPTFHYRLPNCQIEQSGWSLNHCWNIWCVVEYLASHPDIRKPLLEQWLDYQKNNWTNLSEKTWHRDLDTIYQNLL